MKTATQMENAVRIIWTLFMDYIPRAISRMLKKMASYVDRMAMANEQENGRIPVYDIINAGPRHRFMTSDLMVSNCVAADLGMGMDKNLILVKRFGLPVVQMMYTRQNRLFGKNKSGGATSRVQCWTIDKVMALDVLFLSIKNGRIYFPRTWVDMVFLEDILSPYESTTEAGGMEHRIYLRSEGKPDDFCHALCFASMAAMKLMGMDVDDMIPESAFGRGLVSGRPDDNMINPYEE